MEPDALLHCTLENLNKIEGQCIKMQKQNTNKSNYLQSLQLTLNELKNENIRLESELQERKQQHEKTMAANAQLKVLQEFNSNLIKSLYEQQSIVRLLKFRDEIRNQEFQTHLDTQNNFRERILKLKENHENLNIVKQCRAMEAEERKIDQSFDLIVKLFHEEQNGARKKCENLTTEINNQILILVINAKVLSEEAVETSEYLEMPLSKRTAPSIEAEAVPKKLKEPFKIFKLETFSVPKIPEILTKTSPAKKILKLDLENFSDSKGAVSTSINHDKLHSTIKLQKGSRNQVLVKNSENFSKHTKQIGMDRIPHCNPKSPNRETTTSCAAMNIINHGMVSRKSPNTVDIPKKLVKDELKSTNPTFESADIVEVVETKKPIEKIESNKIEILSNVVIKQGTKEFIGAGMSTLHSKFDKKRNVVEEKGCRKTQVEQTCVLIEQKRTLPLESKVDNETSRGQNAEIQLHRSYMIVNKKTSPPISKDPSPPNSVKGIKLKSSTNAPIDLNSELPPTHITINSSNGNVECERSSPIEQMSASPNGSINCLNDFLNNYHADISSLHSNDRKRKGSSDGQADNDTTSDCGFDFANFDLPKRTKTGTKLSGEDFFHIFDAMPKDDGKHADLINFEDLLNF